MKWAKFKILLSSTREGIGKVTEKYEHFQIDKRSVWTLGTSESASIFSEYDAVIIDHTKHILMPPARISQMATYSQKPGSIFVFILNKFLGQNYPNTNYDFFFAYLRMDPSEWKAMYLSDYSGENYQTTIAGGSSPFARYLNTEKKKWDLALKKDYSLYGEKAIPLASNAEGDIVAFTPTGLEKQAFFLPWLDNEEVFWECVNDALLSNVGEAEPPPHWVNTYTVPGLREEEKSIAHIAESISKLELERKGHEQVRSTLEFIRDTLLFRDGDVLHDVVTDVLCHLGIEAENGPIGREDVVFSQSNHDFVCEVKGDENSAAQKHLQQLKKHKSLYDADHLCDSKGILIINPWRKLPIEQRNDRDHQNYPPNVADLAERWDFVMLTTQQLFVAYCQMLDRRFDKQEFAKKLFATKGAFQGLNEIHDYKITSESSQ